MRKLSLALALLSVVLLFGSCQKEEGAFNPKQKIQSQYVSTNGEFVGETTYTWDGDNLVSMFRRTAEPITDSSQMSFEYDGHLVTDIHLLYKSGNRVDSKLFYDDKGRITMLYGVGASDTAFFSYDGNRIKSIVCHQYDSKKGIQSSSISSFLPKSVADDIQKKLQSVSLPKSTYSLEIIINFEWSGKSISKILTHIDIAGVLVSDYTTDFKYGNLKNPLYKLPSGCFEPIVLMGLYRPDDLFVEYGLLEYTLVTYDSYVNGVHDPAPMVWEHATYSYDGEYKGFITKYTETLERNGETFITDYENKY